MFLIMFFIFSDVVKLLFRDTEFPTQIHACIHKEIKYFKNLEALKYL